MTCPLGSETLGRGGEGGGTAGEAWAVTGQPPATADQVVKAHRDYQGELILSRSQGCELLARA